MKLRTLTLSLLLTSALVVPAALAQGSDPSGTANTNANGTVINSGNATGNSPSNANAAGPTDSNMKVNADTNSSANMGNASVTGTADTSMMADTSGWNGKAVTGASGQKLGTIAGSNGDKVTLKTRNGNVELASQLIADDGSGNLTAATTSAQDVQAMGKTQAGDSKGAAAASKRHLANKHSASAATGDQTVASTDQAPAGTTKSTKLKKSSSIKPASYTPANSRDDSPPAAGPAQPDQPQSPAIGPEPAIPSPNAIPNTTPNATGPH